jgi:hypothetical protein
MRLPWVLRAVASIAFFDMDLSHGYDTFSGVGWPPD